MKTRQGFVSNSSSSSFCILGKVVSSAEQEKVEDNSDLSVQYAISGGDEIYAGFAPCCMKDTETLAEFKERIVLEFIEAGVPTTVTELEWITDGGYNG